MKIKLPYGRGYIETEINDINLVGVLESKAHHYQPEAGQEGLVELALDNPISSVPLEELARGKEKIVVITSDHTRPVPSKITLPILLRRIRQGNPQADITILIATGFHRPTTQEEMLDKFGEEIVKNEKLVNHISWNKEDVAFVGILPSGGELWLNKLVLEADLLISEGFIEPHFFAGFSGGRKSVLPGVAGKETVLANHSSEFIASDYSRTGILENNPIHRDMIFAAEQSKLAFIMNVVIDGEKNIIHAVAGDPVKAHVQGCEFVLELARVGKAPADIVVTSNGGYPLDQNVYQSVKSMTAAEATCNEGGVIIVASACNDGHGGEDFFRVLSEAKSSAEVTAQVLARPRHQTEPDQWQYQILARIQEKHQVILVTDCGKEMIEAMKIGHAYSLDEALNKAFALKGKDATVTVVPDGVSVIVG